MTSTTVGFVGDIHGHWRKLATFLDDAVAQVGPIQAVFAVGDVEALREPGELQHVHAPTKHKRVGDFPQVVSGRIQLPAPVYFIGGNHEPWAVLDAQGPGPWGVPEVTFLGRAGVVDVEGLRVAFLSGIHSDEVSEGYERSSVLKRAGCWNQSDVDELLIGVDGPVDVLLTHDWPLLDGAAIPGRVFRVNRGNEVLAELQQLLEPTLHACGHHHRNARVRVGSTTVVALPTVASGPDCLALFRVDEGPSFTEVPLTRPFGQP